MVSFARGSVVLQPTYCIVYCEYLSVPFVHFRKEYIYIYILKTVLWRSWIQKIELSNVGTMIGIGERDKFGCLVPRQPHSYSLQVLQVSMTPSHHGYPLTLRVSSQSDLDQRSCKITLHTDETDGIATGRNGHPGKAATIMRVIPPINAYVTRYTPPSRQRKARGDKNCHTCPCRKQTRLGPYSQISKLV